MTAAEILKLIETVDPSDTAKLDEIDARVCIYLRPKKAAHLASSIAGFREKGTPRPTDLELLSGRVEQVTRSRDALKQIRPEGDWSYASEGCGQSHWFDMNLNGWSTTQFGLPTEELAELHAIIQSLEWERNNEK